jgi:hypothetical protein
MSLGGGKRYVDADVGVSIVDVDNDGAAFSDFPLVLWAETTDDFDAVAHYESAV